MDTPEVELLRSQISQLATSAQAQLDQVRTLQRSLDLLLSVPLTRVGPKDPTESHSNGYSVSVPPPRFNPGSAVEGRIVDWVAQSGRDWKAKELIDYLVRYSNLSEIDYDTTNVYQALSRAHRQGKLSKGAYGVYGPPQNA